MKKIKKALCAAVAVLTLFTGSVMPNPIRPDSGSQPFSIVQPLETEAAANYGRLYDQKNWSQSTRLGKNLRSSGCGIFAFGNAIYALNGKKVDINAVANWAKSNKSWTPGSGGLWRWKFYGKDLKSGNVASKFGSTYNFKIDGCYNGKITDSRLVNHLKKGGVAVIHVPGHFMTVSAYKVSSNRASYYVIESYPTNGRGLSANGWVKKDKLTYGKTNVDWYCLISSTSSKPNDKKNNTNNNNNNSNNNSNNGSNYFKKYTGNSSSIVNALKAIKVDSSYAYRKKIAAANGVSNYRGTSSQNNTLLKLLKKGTLKKPSSSTSNASYFKRYTGNSGSIVNALKAIGADSSYAYRKKIAAANGLSNYRGTASQNNTLLKLLKKGTLKKP